MNYRQKNKPVFIACLVVLVLIGLRFLFPTSFAIVTDTAAQTFAPISISQTAQPTATDGLRVARIIARPPQTAYDTFILSLDTSNVYVGTTLYLPSDIGTHIAIGKIISVEGSYAHASLFSSSGQTNQVIISRTGATIPVVGQGGGTFSARVPKDFDVRAGDTLTDESSGLVAAQVSFVGIAGADSFKQILAKVPSNVFTAEWVLVAVQAGQ